MTDKEVKALYSWMSEFGFKNVNENGKQIIMESLKYRTPMKPEKRYGSYYCPTCGELSVPEGDVIYLCDKFCGYCGQAIDWEDKEKP